MCFMTMMVMMMTVTTLMGRMIMMMMIVTIIMTMMMIMMIMMVVRTMMIFFTRSSWDKFHCQQVVKRQCHGRLLEDA